MNVSKKLLSVFFAKQLSEGVKSSATLVKVQHIQNTLTTMISAMFGHRRDWSQELFHQSFDATEQQRVTVTASDEHEF